MNYLLIVILLVSSGAYAQPHPDNLNSYKRFGTEPGSGDCLEYITVTDRDGSFEQDVSVKTSLGVVVIRYVTQGPHYEPDTAEVVDMDEGISVTPFYKSLIPDEPVYFCVRKSRGLS